MDTAHRMAELCRAAGDPSGADWAAHQGLLASPGNEILYRDRMLAADAAGNPTGVHTAMGELCDVLEADDPTDRVQSRHLGPLRRAGEQMVEASNGIDACVEHRQPEDHQSRETGPARRARLRDAPRVARVAAGAARRNAHRGRPGRHAHHFPAVQAGLWAASSVHAVMMGNLWISVAADAIAVVRPISGPGTARQRLRLLAIVALIGTGLNAPLAVIGPEAVNLAALLFLCLALSLCVNLS